MSTIPVLEGYRISPEQRRAWIVQQSKKAEPGASAVVMVEGCLDSGRFRGCVDWIAKEYEILRTNFQQVNGMTEPLQVISSDAEWQWSKKDLTGYSAQEQQEIVNRAAGTRVQQMSVELISLSDRSTAVVFCMPALVTDRMGLISLVCAVILRYLDKGQESPVQAQYADIAQSLNESLESPEFDAGRSYWMQQWSGEARQEALARSLCVPDGKSFEKASVRVQGIAGQSVAILKRCNEWNCTPQDFLLACWLTLALRHDEGWMPVVGFGGGGRNHEVIAEAPGLLVRYVPVWVDVSLQTPLREMVGKVAASTSDAVEWQQFFAWKQIESATPIPILRWCFESCSVEEGIGAEGIHFQITGVWGISDGFARRLVVQERKGSGGFAELAGEIDYDAAGMRAQEAQWLAEELETLVAGALEKPEAVIGTLPIIGPMQRELLSGWNQTKEKYAREKRIHELFGEQVERTPDAIAVACGEEQVSYGHLNLRANRLAHYLISLGVKPDDRVGICVERGLEMVIGIMGIVKAGAAYVPLDPSYPPERLRFMVEDSRPVVVMTQESLRSTVEEIGDEIRVVEFGAVMNRPGDREEERNPGGLGQTSQNLCYVIYTSGSTGQPKGAMNEHHALVNRLQWMQEAYGLDNTDVVLQKTSFSFDVSVWEFFWTLLQGATLAVPPPGAHKNPVQMVELIRKWKVTTLHFVPSMLGAFINTEGVEGCTSIRRLICSGEALSAWHVTLSQEKLPGAQLYNLYGPTEAAIDVTAWTRPTGFAGSIVPIGRPIANTQIHLLDRYREPVPVGVAGEIYIGGAGVARGYLKRADMTADRFVPDAYAGETGARMYKTGDLGRWLEDGNIEFVGRNDDQVKIRGYRIELGEIEARLAEHEHVREAVVVVREDGNGEKRLVAYVVAESEPDAGELAGRLRAYLVGRLPEHMVPAAYVRLERMPLTPNGKLDRKALPAPKGNAHAQRMYEAPRGEMEEKLATLWQELLGVEHVGRQDHFFELGGHSLLAVQLVGRLQRLNLKIDVRALFATPVLSKLAATLDHYSIALIPPLLIEPDSTAITPEMLPLIDLKQEEIDRIVERIPGGIANIQDIYGLSSLQEGFLFHHLMASQGDPFIMSAQIAFPDRVLLDRFLSTAQQVVDRHDILRTCFMWEGLSQPAQVVLRSARIRVTEVTFDPKDGPVREQLARHFDPRQHRIDLTQAPLLHFAIAHDPEDGRWVLSKQLHHMIGDHSTLDTLRAEVSNLLAGQDDKLIPPQPFRNLIAQARRGVSQEEHQRFFREMLGEVTEPTLPFGLVDVTQDGAKLVQSSVMLSQELNERLRSQARRLGVSLATLCHLAWGQVLARSSGNERVVFGTVLFGRMQAGDVAGRTVGMFINTLPVRLDFDDMETEAAVRQVHIRLGELLMHEHASLVLAQRCSGIVAPNPLFSAILNYRYGRMPSLENGVEKVDPLAGTILLEDYERNNYPLTMSIEDLGRSIWLTALTEEPFTERICGYMQQSLESLVYALESEPHMPVRQLEILPPAERQQLLVEWNATEKEYPEQVCIHHLFEEQVEKTPDATAVVYEDRSLTYRELNQCANQLAHYLINLGVRPDEPVAICVERSLGMVIGLLGILKAGGAYVPLDPSYPCERLKQIMQNAEPKLLLSDARGRVALGQILLKSLTVLQLDTAGQPEILPSPWANLSANNPDSREMGLTPHHAAYVIYTSGSSGTPKGVVNQHRSLINRLVWMQQAYGLDSTDLVLQKTSFSFDVSVWEFFWTLLTGATLVMAPPEAHKDPLQLIELIRKHKITTLHFVPSMLGPFVNCDGVEECTSLRRLICSGEALPAVHVRAYQEKVPGSQLHNLYGPTEAAIDVTAWPCPPDFDGSVVPIGRPIANTSIYLLDANGQPVPLGAIGEIYIGGVGVARGYLHRAEMTAGKFVPDPFSKKGGERLYKTGDLARFLPDGNIEFLGRNDHQVKIRGFRIELGEIETQLSEHPQVRESVVIAREDGGGAKRLVAYVVVAESNAEEESSSQQRGEVEAGELSAVLRTYLAGRLPEYMVPAAYVRLECMPLTPNGKLDRRALPEPESNAYARRGYVEPQGETESKLAKIWEKLLGAPQVGLHDNFFELGGHSLMVIQLMVEVQRLFGINISLRDVFMAPTLAELAAAVKRGDLGIRPQNLIPVRPAGTQTPLFMVHALGGGVDYVVDLAPFIDADIPIYGLQATGFAPGEEPLKTIEEMAELYLGGIRQVQPHGPYQIAGWSAGGTIACEMARRLVEMGEQVAFVGLLDTVYFERMTMDSEIKSPKDFDPKHELIQVLSMILEKQVIDKQDLDGVIELSQTCDFETLIQRSSHVMNKIAKEYPSADALDPSTLLRILAIRHATANALFNYSHVGLSVPVWLFEAMDTVPLSGPRWRNFLGDYLQIVPVQGTHHTMTSLENVRSLGAAITDALAKNSVQILSSHASHPLTRSAAQV
jgi:amino acid adenylation domain-containing protein